MNTNKLRAPLDITMTLLSVILMGGTMLFPDDRIHQICGMALLALWAVHIALNRLWFGGLFKGRRDARRALQITVNAGILICALTLGASGLLMAWFVPAEFVGGALDFARTAHLLASHWYYIFMAFHIGLHGSMILRACHSRAQACHSSAPTRESGQKAPLALRIAAAALCLYGIYAFIARGLWKYMLGLQQFFFFDFERGHVLFALDYLCILVLFGTISYYLGKLATKTKENN
ncbi:MAG: DUF4405 domain-containing protein [Treponema sp.]|nr:DUF4405 domain-containing protein [Treponema sp.]